MDNAHDLDKLTDPELVSMGLDPRLYKKHQQRGQKKCTMCNKPVAEPVTSYKVKGFQFLEEGDSVHLSCIEKKAKAMIEYAKQLIGGGDA